LLSAWAAALSAAGWYCVPVALTGALFALGLALPVWVLARRDLKEMRAGRRDPAGRGQTRLALEAARYAVLFGLIVLAAGLGMLAVAVAAPLLLGQDLEHWERPLVGAYTVVVGFVVAACAWRGHTRLGRLRQGIGYGTEGEEEG
jgi:hypothetical protein